MHTVYVYTKEVYESHGETAAHPPRETPQHGTIIQPISGSQMFILASFSQRCLCECFSFNPLPLVKQQLQLE